MIKATYCVEIFHSASSKFLSYLLGCDECSHWVAISHWLANCYNVGYDIIGLKGPEVFTDATKSSLNFVSNAEPTCLVDHPVNQKSSQK